MQIENRTPHSVALMGKDGNTKLLPPVYPTVRLLFSAGPVDGQPVQGIPVHKPDLVRSVSGLPPMRDGVLLLVSRLAAAGVAALHPERRDVVHPGTGAHKGILRDASGVLAVASLVRAS